MRIKVKDQNGIRIHCRSIDRSIGMAEAELLHAHADLTAGRATASQALSNAQESLNMALGDWDSKKLAGHVHDVVRLSKEVRQVQKKNQPVEKVATRILDLRRKLNALAPPGCPKSVVVRKK